MRMLPHKEKIVKGGEDAVGLMEQLLVVSDGVGGWTMSGVDPALFSK
jgi:protein phosphatase PTC7